MFATVLPLGHAIGRIGCFSAGCCYGIPFDSPFSVTYTETLGTTPLGIPLFPVQIVESILLVLLFSAQLVLFLRLPQKQNLPVMVYLTAYPTIRFLLEFLRGDSERGVLLGLSTSQWVSLLILIAVPVGYLCWRHKRRKAQAS